MPKARRSRTIPIAVEDVWTLVSDPYSLPRWWPKTRRIENAADRTEQTYGRWTQVLETEAGHGVRAEFECVNFARHRRYSWEQRIVGTPFARHFRSSRVDIELSDKAEHATFIELCSTQSLSGISRLGTIMVRRGQGRILEEALDGLELALIDRRTMCEEACS
jgi:uncharacterized protein YndB with AHSA1/START domain